MLHIKVGNKYFLMFSLYEKTCSICDDKVYYGFVLSVDLQVFYIVIFG